MKSTMNLSVGLIILGIDIGHAKVRPSTVISVLWLPSYNYAGRKLCPRNQHTGYAFVGLVGGEDSLAEFTALGDYVNRAARLASEAGPGEILVSDAAYSAAGLNLGDLEHQQLELKGKSEPIGVHILHVIQD